jgi:4-hydroxy-4-methyl-2-oxoglutarate aldolase
MTFSVGKRPPRPSDIDETLNKFRKVSTGSLGHLTDFGYAIGLEALKRPQKAVGLAFTVRIPNLDATAVHYSLGLIERGEVLVIDTSGERHRACWGGVVAHAAMLAGVAGVIVDGPVTDWAEVTGSGPPVWCRGLSALTGRRLGLEGSVMVPVQIGGAVVQPGDIVFADTDGVFFVSTDGAAQLAETLIIREAREPELKRRLDAGETIAEISGAAKIVQESLARG